MRTFSHRSSALRPSGGIPVDFIDRLTGSYGGSKTWKLNFHFLVLRMLVRQSPFIVAGGYRNPLAASALTPSDGVMIIIQSMIQFRYLKRDVSLSRFSWLLVCALGNVLDVILQLWRHYRCLLHDVGLLLSNESQVLLPVADFWKIESTPHICSNFQQHKVH